MSLIKCTGNCKYQKDGACTLANVADWHGSAALSAGCVYQTEPANHTLTMKNGQSAKSSD